MPFFYNKKISALKGSIHLLSFVLTTVCFTCPTYAQDLPLPLPRFKTPTTNITGVLGLNTIPNARMDKVGTVRLGSAITDPYIHSYMGFQLMEPLYINLRQTAEISDFGRAANHLYPGMDIKLRLAKETATRPAIAIGLDSALGHRRMSSEYLTLSKRFNNFDLTGGVAWGRLGSAGHIKNPLRGLSSHFRKNRDFNSNQPQSANNWFTGEDIGFFGGIEYFTPVEGLSIKADYGANAYIGERSISDFKAPKPWGISLNYKPWEQTDLSAGVIGGTKIMAAISLQNQIYKWPGRSAPKTKITALISPRPYNKKADINSVLSLSAHELIGKQIGKAARNIANNIPEDREVISITLKHKKLRGPTINIIRKDLENAILNNHGSPEEIWHDTSIQTAHKNNFYFKNAFNTNTKKSRFFRFILDLKSSLSEVDTGALYRGSALIEGQKLLPQNFISGARARINLIDNLSRVSSYRTSKNKTIRSDENVFAAQRFAIDQLYLSWLVSLNSNTHIAFSTGYLEEMFSGYGGEILHRPYGKTFAIGVEGWGVKKRNPLSAFNMKLSSEQNFTGHLNLFYELPKKEITAYAKIGQYLGEDVGVTLGLNTRFDNNATLKGFVTTTNKKDTDFFGGTTHIYSGIQLSLPLGNISFMPTGSELRVSTLPFARDTGQILDHPLSLYETTEPISYRRINHSWQTLLD